MTRPDDGHLHLGEPDDDPPARCPRCGGPERCWVYLEGGQWLCCRCYDAESGAVIVRPARLLRSASAAARCSSCSRARGQRKRVECFAEAVVEQGKPLQAEYDERQRYRDG